MLIEVQFFEFYYFDQWGLCDLIHYNRLSFTLDSLMSFILLALWLELVEPTGRELLQ